MVAHCRLVFRESAIFSLLALVRSGLIFWKVPGAPRLSDRQTYWLAMYTMPGLCGERTMGAFHW
jgi:hypothetical protein